MTDHFVHIYTAQADAYHRLIEAEDVEANLPRQLTQLADFAGARWLDVGSGTGRLPLLLHHLNPCPLAVDLHAAMLTEQRHQRGRVGGAWPLAQADARHLPVPTASVDVVTAGWALGHLCGWYPHTWHTHLEAALAEMRRVVRPGGTLLILETLGTGFTLPTPPAPHLAEYYAHLEAAHGFARHTIRTDYQFASPAEAEAVLGFFFGADLIQKIRAQRWARIPEWTGVWALMARW